jgi:alkylation response protein AidB-like acyl-CoA dehydrogenase
VSTDLLSRAIALDPRVRELSRETEEGRRVPAELAKELGAAGLWRSCVPSAVGGLEVPLGDLLATFEVLARADGAVGWVAMIGATTGLVYAYLDPDVARDIISGDPCTCGVFAPSGRAVPAQGGYSVSGRWAFASGVQNASWLSLGVVVDANPPDVLAVLVPASDIDVIDTWMVSGLKGTGSHHIEMHDVFVPAERTFRLVGGEPQSPGALYAFPVFGLLALGVGSVALGIARSAIDELVALAADKTPTASRRRLADRAHIQMEMAKAATELAAARALVYDTVGRAWKGAEDGVVPSLELRAQLRLAATHATRTAADVVDRMYDAGGGTSVYATSRLQRDFRDIHAATQHMVVSPSTYELTGRILLGVETDVSLL